MEVIDLKNNGVGQLAHLQETSISRNTCKSIVIDTLLANTSGPINVSGLSNEITNNFKLLITEAKIKAAVNELEEQKAIEIDRDKNVRITPVYFTELSLQNERENRLQANAIKVWIDRINKANSLTGDEIDKLEQVMPVFLRKVFIRNGVSSYEIINNKKLSEFDLLETALETVETSFANDGQKYAEYLCGIFQDIDDENILEYLVHNIKRAVGYISEVISDETASRINQTLEHLTIYLDTNIIYRLFNLQGEHRYNSIKKTIEFCRMHHISLKVSYLTEIELRRRLKYDADVLLRFPAKVDLSFYGYKYRTSDNYVSTYWKESIESGISISEFNNKYKNYDSLLRQYNIEIEKNPIVSEHQFKLQAQSYYEKISVRDTMHQKTDPSMWHDAYNIAYIQTIQNPRAHNAIDSGVIFLSTDRNLLNLQKTDYELAQYVPVIIAPSELLTIFNFSEPLSGYEETFVEFFASSSVGTVFAVSNEEIQEILSRISLYDDVDDKIAEEILLRELVSTKYKDATADERTEIVGKDIDVVLQEQWKKAETASEELKDKNTKLSEEIENQKKQNEQLAKDKTIIEKKLSEETAQLEQKQKDIENLDKEKSDAEDRERRLRDSIIRKRMFWWKNRRRVALVLGVALTLAVVTVAIYLAVVNSNQGYFSLLGLLAITCPIFAWGMGIFSDQKQNEATVHYEKILDNEFGKK